MVAKKVAPVLGYEWPIALRQEPESLVEVGQIER